MKLHKEVDPESRCRGQVTKRTPSGNYWCVYCGTRGLADD